jgi:hypothetical protein
MVCREIPLSLSIFDNLLRQISTFSVSRVSKMVDRKVGLGLPVKL